MPSTAVHQVVTDALTQYIASPWTWPRERDLTVDIVTRLRALLPPITLPTRLSLPSRLVDVGCSTPRTVPRVRTEVKVRQKPVDVGIFSEKTVATFLEVNGARDVVLAVEAGDLAALLELKLYPDLYIDHGQCLWLCDLQKLAEFAEQAACGVLFMDTSLPLSNVGVTYRRGRISSLERRLPGLPPWPLRNIDFEVVLADQVIRFDLTDAPKKQGLYFWALAVRIGSVWMPVFDGASGLVPLLPAGDVIVCCWAVTITKA